MAKAVIQSNIITTNGSLKVAPGATVSIRREAENGALPLVQLWADRAGTQPVANPVIADGKGFFRVYADPWQRVKITVTAPGVEAEARDVPLLATPGSAAGVNVEDVSAFTAAGVFESAAAGDAALDDGEYFWVPDEQDLQLYLTRESDDPELILTLPGLGSVVRFDDVETISALTSASIFGDLAGGESATSDGDYFWVLESDRFVLYLNASGSGVEQAEWASFAVVEAVVGQLEDRVNDLEEGLGQLEEGLGPLAFVDNELGSGLDDIPRNSDLRDGVARPLPSGSPNLRHFTLRQVPKDSGLSTNEDAVLLIGRCDDGDGHVAGITVHQVINIASAGSRTQGEIRVLSRGRHSAENTSIALEGVRIGNANYTVSAITCMYDGARWTAVRFSDVNSAALAAPASIILVTGWHSSPDDLLLLPESEVSDIGPPALVDDGATWFGRPGDNMEFRAPAAEGGTVPEVDRVNEWTDSQLFVAPNRWTFRSNNDESNGATGGLWWQTEDETDTLRVAYQFGNERLLVRTEGEVFGNNLSVFRGNGSSGGVNIGSPSGGDPGFGVLNAEGLQINGQSVVEIAGGTTRFTLTSNGSVDLSSFSGADRVRIRMWGAGGSGANRNNSGARACGGGGGAYFELEYLRSELPSTLFFTVGGGGAARFGTEAGQDGGFTAITIGGRIFWALGGQGGLLDQVTATTEGGRPLIENVDDDVFTLPDSSASLSQLADLWAGGDSVLTGGDGAQDFRPGQTTMFGGASGGSASRIPTNNDRPGGLCVVLNTSGGVGTAASAGGSANDGGTACGGGANVQSGRSGGGGDGLVIVEVTPVVSN